MCLWNAHSICNKTFLLHDYISEHDIDIMFITETWLRAEDPVVIAECSPPGYTFMNVPRPTDPHGGIAVIFKSPLQLHLKVCESVTFSTFELAHVVSKAGSIHFLVVYRPPPSSRNRFRTADFLQELDDLTAEISRLSGRVLLRDFNIHVDMPSKSEVAQFLSIIESANLSQHVHDATHNMGHTLDLVMTRNEGNLQGQSSTDINSIHDCVIKDIVIHRNLMSDHHCIRFVLKCPKPVMCKVKQIFRNFKEMDVEGFKEALVVRVNNPLSMTGDVNSLLAAYTTAVATCVDEFAPQKSILRSTRVRNPWFNEEILVARRVRRRAERKWIKSSSETDHTAFKLSNRHVNEIIVKTKQKYIMELLCKANAKTVFQTVNNLLHKNVKVLPMYDNPTDLANRFALFFVNKISDIHNNVTGTPPREGCKMCNTVYENDWNEFETVSEDNRPVHG